jgi:hypothetical protein
MVTSDEGNECGVAETNECSLMGWLWDEVVVLDDPDFCRLKMNQPILKIPAFLVTTLRNQEWIEFPPDIK